MTEPDEPQPRDIALEQPSPELLQELEDKSAPEQPRDGDQQEPAGAGTAAQREATEFGGE